ncbi:hypothetical protein P12x_000925 [Tundrisphaera lichenicola]|uniref:hypothetical protein n=1 Tax=Tundrisphaera lichenicola TaxID=2029860 RepID=UPI003EC022D1
MALQKDDRSLLEHAFSLLGMDGGHNECYGESSAGAGACYILRAGSKQDRSRLSRLIRNDEAVRRRIVDGLWQEYGLSHKVIAKIFDLSNYDDRFEIMVRVDIRDSEKFDVRDLLRLLLRLDLKPWEEILLHLTKNHRNWA